MKQKTFDRIIDKTSAVLAFDNHDADHTWRVALHEGKMLVRKEVDEFGSDFIELTDYEIDFADVFAVEKMYYEIVDDVVLCFGEAMYEHTLAEYEFLANVAAKDDDGFSELLSYFGVNWAEFVADVFHVYTNYIESMWFEDLARDLEDEHVCDMEDYHLVDKVLSRLNFCDAMVCYGDELGIYWQVTCAHGEFWYRKYEIWDLGDDDHCVNCADWGHFSEDDEEAMAALADAIAVAIDGQECVVDYDPVLFDVLGIEIEEMAD